MLIMDENLGICRGSGTIFCHLKIGSDGMQLSRNGKNFYVLLNNRTILSAKSEKDFLSKNVPVIVSIVKSMAKKAGLDSMHWLPTTDIKKDNKMVSDALNFIQTNLKPAEVFVLQIVPDEIQDQQPKDASKRPSVIDKLSEYQSDLQTFSTTIDGVRYASETLLRTNLEKKMWGSKEVMDIINGSHSEMDKLAENFEKVEYLIEHSGDWAGIIQTALKRNLKTASIKETAGKTLEGFSFLKSFMSKLAQNLHPLYTIDKDFKARVGYPATWFFNPSTFMNFTFEYENLIDNIIKMASLESEIIEPILVWKMT
jgi:hypothetical protein